MAENISKIYLLNVPIESDYKNTLYFANQEAQHSYFVSRLYKSYPDCSYQRKDQTIRIDAHIDTLYKNCNYVMYQNTAYSNKWFYAFITNMEYVNDGRTNITIETDCIQTWMFDYTIKSSFVDREHTTSDELGEHTIPENLEIGIEMTVNDFIHKKYSECYTVVASNYNPDTDKKFAGITFRSGIVSGTKWYVFDTSLMDIESLNEQLSLLGDFILECTKDGQAENIQSIFAVPKALLPDEELIEDGKYKTIKASTYFTSTGTAESVSIERPTTIAGYKPKNNKLFTFPYCYILATNNSGSTNIYKYEDFYYNLFQADGSGEQVNYRNCSFGIDQIPSEGCAIKITPQGYKGMATIEGGFRDEGFMCGKFPTFSWSSDAYTNWLTQNAVNMASSVGMAALGGIAQMGSGAVSGAMAGGVYGALGGAIAGGVSGVASTFQAVAGAMIQMHNANFLPNIAQGNVNGGDINFASGEMGFYFYLMSIKQEYAKSIDDYFTMFGYKCNRVKVPNTNHRSRFWFTKTLDINIHGAIPNQDMHVIKNCYNNGITFWRDPADINNYEDPNDITV